MNCARPPWRSRSSWADGRRSLARFLHWKPDSPNQVLESDIGSQTIESRIENLEQPRRSFYIGFLQPFDCQVRLAPARVNHAQVVGAHRSEEHTSELQSLRHLGCRLLL